MDQADIAVYGLGTMGSALALNLADKGFRVAVSNRETDWISDFVTEAGPLAAQFVPTQSLADLVRATRAPRSILFMIPSGAPMEEMIAQVTPLLEIDDTIIDAGNADFNDTQRRTKALQGTGLHYVGMGVSGGEQGARHGPSMMVGGSDHSWAQLKPKLEAIAAQFQDDPCVAHIGPDGAGHFVKTVHNGIEYADMQMIAEVYGILRDGAGWPAARIGALFRNWNNGPLASYLVEITGRALGVTDPETDQPMTDVILDKAGQKGTGRWTVIEALKLGQSASAIEGSVAARAWSAEKTVRVEAEALLMPASLPADLPEPEQLRDALLAGRILAHAQGFRVLSAASEAHGWSLDLARIAEIWRAGCIIRSALLDDLAGALRDGPPHGHLLLAPVIRDKLAASVPGLRATVSAAARGGWSVPSLSAALAWYDAMRRGRGTANLIQTQRDVFGAHGFERIDMAGTFNADWS